MNLLPSTNCSRHDTVMSVTFVCLRAAECKRHVMHCRQIHVLFFWWSCSNRGHWKTSVCQIARPHRYWWWPTGQNKTHPVIQITSNSQSYSFKRTMEKLVVINSWTRNMLTDLGTCWWMWAVTKIRFNIKLIWLKQTFMWRRAECKVMLLLEATCNNTS